MRLAFFICLTFLIIGIFILNVSAKKELASITNLTNTTGNFWINWTWENPKGDLSHVIIYINGTWKTNTSNKNINFYNDTYWPHANQTISTRTVDDQENINETWVNQTTTIPNNPIFIIDIPATITINENETLFIDANATDLDNDNPVFSCNNTSLFQNFNATTGKANFTPFYNQSGIYVVEFGVSDCWGSTNNTSMIITVIDIPLVITSQWNSYTNDSSVAFTAKQLSTIFFNITTNRTPTYVRWYLNDALQQNSSSLNWTKKFDATGTYIINVSANDQYDITLNSTWTITIPPPPVTGLVNDTPTTSTVNLSWNPAIDNGTVWGYEVFKNNTHLAYTQNAYYNVTGLSENTLYQFKVRANDTSNNWGENSTVLNVITASVPNTAPSLSGQNPASPYASELGVSATFNATSNQSNSNNEWRINDILVEWDNNTASPMYTNVSGVLGTWNVALRSHNASDYNLVSEWMNWTWTVQDITPPTKVTGLVNDTPTTSTVNLSWNPAIDNGTVCGDTQKRTWTVNVTISPTPTLTPTSKQTPTPTPTSTDQTGSKASGFEIVIGFIVVLAVWRILKQ